MILGFGCVQDFREGTEKVPSKIKESETEIKSEYLKGFFDSQGCVDTSSRKVFGLKKNLEVIKKIKTLLGDIGIRSCIRDKNGSTFNTSAEYFRIRVSWRNELKKYSELINFSINRKQKTLERELGSYTYEYKRWTNKGEEILKKMYDRNTSEMSIMLNRSKKSVQAKARRMGLTKVIK